MSNQPVKRLPTPEILHLLAKASPGQMVAYVEENGGRASEDRADRPGIDAWDGTSIIFYGTEQDDAGIYGETKEERDATAHLFAASRSLGEEVVESRPVLSTLRELQRAEHTLTEAYDARRVSAALLVAARIAKINHRAAVESWLKVSDGRSEIVHAEGCAGAVGGKCECHDPVEAEAEHQRERRKGPPAIERGRDEYTTDTCRKCHGAVFGDRCLNCDGPAPEPVPGVEA